MDKYIDKFSPEELDALRRCVSYGWRPAVTAKIMNCRYGLSLNAHDLEQKSRPSYQTSFIGAHSTRT